MGLLHHRALLRCDAARAFSLFTENAQIERWLVPLAEVEPVLGGKFELFWTPEDRENNSTVGCTITALVANQLLAFDWKGPQQFKAFMNEADPLTHVTVSFIPTDGGTEVHLVHTGWRCTPEWEEARQWFDVAWTMAFHELEKQVNGIPVA